MFVEVNRAVRSDRQALGVAVAIGVDGRMGSVMADEGIVIGDAAVGVNAHRFAQQAAQILGCFAEVEAVAGGQQQGAIRQEVHAAAVVNRRRLARLHREDHLGIDQGAIHQPGAQDFGGVVVGGRRGVGKEEGLVACKAGMQQHVEQPTLAQAMHLGHTGNGLAQRALRRDFPKRAAEFGDQQPAIRKEGDAPRKIQALRNGNQLVVLRSGNGRRQTKGQSHNDRFRYHKTPVIFSP